MIRTDLRVIIDEIVIRVSSEEEMTHSGKMDQNKSV